MKKFFAFAAVALAATFASCSGNTNQEATDTVAVDSTIVEEVVAPVDSAVAVVDSVVATDSVAQ